MTAAAGLVVVTALEELPAAVLELAAWLVVVVGADEGAVVTDEVEGTVVVVVVTAATLSNHRKKYVSHIQSRDPKNCTNVVVGTAATAEVVTARVVVVAATAVEEAADEIDTPTLRERKGVRHCVAWYLKGKRTRRCQDRLGL